ncbi:hypothetical protein MKX01_007175 [Papaver californicum]|nr:hypothetical protein MKX01_007175 [Papaver californicum]
MEVQNAQPRHIIEISRDVISEGSSSNGTTKICSGTSCGFSDVGTLSKDAKERAASMRKLWISIALCVVFMTVEIVGGLKANSLAILTDAAHLLSDVAAFGISLFSVGIKIEILGTLVSIQMIWLLAGILVYEAISRMINDTGEVQGFLMFLVSAFGLVVNLFMAVLLGHDHGHGEHGHYHGHGHNHSHDVHDPHAHTHSSHDHEHEHGSEHSEPLLKSSEDGNNNTIVVGKEKKKRNINVQGAYLHVLGDSIQSIGVMIGGAIIWYKPEWKIIDLICTLIFSVIVLGTTIRMLRNIMEVLLACHVKVKPDADANLVLGKVIDHIKRAYSISHVTIQIER